MANARHLVLTGAPGAGKTTLLNVAAAIGYRTSPEVARRLLKQPGGMELRQTNPLGFAEAMLDAHMCEFELHGSEAETVWFDRGFPDVVGFLKVSGLEIPEEVDRICRELRYQGPVFRAPIWPSIYKSDSERTQDLKQAVESDRAVTMAWKRYGYDVVDLPLAPVEDRIDFIIRAIG